MDYLLTFVLLPTSFCGALIFFLFIFQPIKNAWLKKNIFNTVMYFWAFWKFLTNYKSVLSDEWIKNIESNYKD